MPLRNLARKLGGPATASLKRAPHSGGSPVAGSRLLASRASQNGQVKRAVNGNGSRDKVDKGTMDFEEASRAVNMLPKVSLLSAALGIILGPCSAVFLFGGLEGNRKRFV